LYVSFQQDPQFSEFHPAIAETPPMKGNFGSEPNVGYFATRPCDPSEQATVFREVDFESYVSSYDVERVTAGVVRARRAVDLVPHPARVGGQHCEYH
jgi:hypothetical protein